MTLILTVLALCVIGLFVYAKLELKDRQKIDDKINELNKTLTSLGSDKSHINNHVHAISFNDDKKEITFVRDNIKTISYKDILQVELVEDKESLTKVARKSQLAGVLVGSIFGSTGALIGGLSGKKNHIESVKEISLRLIISDTQSPVDEFKFYIFDDYVNKKLDVYKNAYNEVFEWYKLIEVLIHQADKEDEMAKAQ